MRVPICPQGKNPVSKDGNPCPASRDQALLSVDQEEYYIPSVDLLTAQVGPLGGKGFNNSLCRGLCQLVKYMGFGTQPLAQVRPDL